jgi:hypothetical protein
MSTFGKAHDPLYDMEVSIERQLFFKVKAAISMVIRTKRSVEQIFKLFLISVQEWRHFVMSYPQEIEKLKTANAVFFFASCTSKTASFHHEYPPTTFCSLAT